MPDELTPGQNETGQGGHEEVPGDANKDFDFERGYTELRPAYTQATQQLAATNERLTAFETLFEQLHDEDLEVQQAAMDALGFELDTGQPTGPAANDPEEWVDPLEEEVNALRAWKDEQEQRLELEASLEADEELIDLRDDYIEAEVETLESWRQQPFTEREEEVLGNLAISMGQDDVPDVRGAYQALYGEDGVLETNRKGWIETKQSAAQAPFGNTVPLDRKPQNERERVSYYDQRVAAMENQQ